MSDFKMDPRFGRSYNCPASRHNPGIDVELHMATRRVISDSLNYSPAVEKQIDLEIFHLSSSPEIPTEPEDEEFFDENGPLID